jgi:hypothetical protein
MSDRVQDSSIYLDPKTFKVIHSQENRLFIGIVMEVRNVETTKELRYMVEVHYKTDPIILPCRMLRQFGGVYNYEDYVMRGYDHAADSNGQNGITAVAGDVVLVGLIGGNGREGVILGSMTHPARKSFLDAAKGPQYKSEFNGIETSINEDGEWTLTFKGQPTNLDKLKDVPDKVIPAPEYDTDIGSSYMKWDKTGSFTLSDEATDGDKVQKLFIDKKNGTIDVLSGKVRLHISKSDQTVRWTNKTYIVESDKIRLGEEGASDWLILGSTFRKEQKTMNNSMSEQLNAAWNALEIAKTALNSAGSSMSAPISGAVAAGPQIILASTAIDQAAQALAKVGQAISTFESNGASTDYLSKISKTK